MSFINDKWKKMTIISNVFLYGNGYMNSKGNRAVLKITTKKFLYPYLRQISLELSLRKIFVKHRSCVYYIFFNIPVDNDFLEKTCFFFHCYLMKECI